MVTKLKAFICNNEFKYCFTFRNNIIVFSELFVFIGHLVNEKVVKLNAGYETSFTFTIQCFVETGADIYTKIFPENFTL